eukprot:3062762-Rhodomonas_salina.1
MLLHTACGCRSNARDSGGEGWCIIRVFGLRGAGKEADRTDASQDDLVQSCSKAVSQSGFRVRGSEASSRRAIWLERGFG